MSLCARWGRCMHSLLLDAILGSRAGECILVTPTGLPRTPPSLPGTPYQRRAPCSQVSFVRSVSLPLSRCPFGLEPTFQSRDLFCITRGEQHFVCGRPSQRSPPKVSYVMASLCSQYGGNQGWDVNTRHCCVAHELANVLSNNVAVC